MRVVAHCPHGPASVPELPGLLAELSSVLDMPGVRLGEQPPASIKRTIQATLLRSGWARDVRLPHSNLSVGYVRGSTAMCVQLGNVSRTYADLLKLQTLLAMGRAGLSVEVLPVDIASKAMGSNHASYERLVREVGLFDATISGPLLILALGNGT